MKLTLLFAALLFSTEAFAGRSLLIPQFAWHDWLQAQAWCTDSGHVYAKVLEFVFTNVSNRAQPVKLTCTGSAFDSASAANPTEKLSYTNNISGKGETSPGTVLTTDITVDPGTSQRASCVANYRGPGDAGDWHIIGAFDIKISIDDDRGAILATLNSTFENTCVGFSNDAIGLAIMSLRNTPRTIPVNGGRAF